MTFFVLEFEKIFISLEAINKVPIFQFKIHFYQKKLNEQETIRSKQNDSYKHRFTSTNFRSATASEGYEETFPS